MDSSSSNGIPRPQAALDIDYLAKDYASFRQLMLDRMATLLPDWNERSPADVGVMLTELLAYAADQLSYYQDAVATEAYLSTARHRVSLRRHARLLDYPLHDGCNARVLVAVQVSDRAPGGLLLPAGTQLLTYVAGMPVALVPAQVAAAREAGAQVFETMHDITLNARHNRMPLYADAAAGATGVTLRVQSGAALAAGDLLIFEWTAEGGAAAVGGGAGANPTLRHPVRVTQAVCATDSKSGAILCKVLFGVEDALPVALRASTAVATGNVVLADHGYTLPVPEVLTTLQVGGRSEAALDLGPLTYRGGVFVSGVFHPYDPMGAAGGICRFAIQDARPAIRVRDSDGVEWTARRDLLRSRRSGSDFVVEIDERGRAALRFGDGQYGRRPGGTLLATYRVGNGRAGNIGAESLSHIVWNNTESNPTILGVRNPMIAQGGVDPEPIEQVRLHAPHVFKLQERAVSTADYATMALRHPEVKDARAGLRFVGRGYAVCITVQRRGGLPVDDAFRDELLQFLERYRMAGQHIVVAAPKEVAVDIALTAQVASNHLRSVVKNAIWEKLGLAVVKGAVQVGRPGILADGELRLGRPLYLSQIVSAAMQVDGVQWAEMTRFSRYGGKDCRRAGLIALSELEAAIIRNDQARPWLGRFELTLGGGQ